MATNQIVFYSFSLPPVSCLWCITFSFSGPFRFAALCIFGTKSKWVLHFYLLFFAAVTSVIQRGKIRHSKIRMWCLYLIRARKPEWMHCKGHVLYLNQLSAPGWLFCFIFALYSFYSLLLRHLFWVCFFLIHHVSLI